MNTIIQNPGSDNSPSIEQQFPALVGQTLLERSENCYERDKDILSKRFELDGERVCTLESLGVYYDLTRERVRQIESILVRRISNVLSGRTKLGSPLFSVSYREKYDNVIKSVCVPFFL